MSDMYEDVRSLVSSICRIDESLIGPEVNLLDDLSIDSIDFTDIVYEIDKKYGIKLPVTDWMSEIKAGTGTTSDYFAMSRFVSRIRELTTFSQSITAG